MAVSQSILQAAPLTTDVLYDITESHMLASAPMTAAYDSHLRKAAQHREDQRRRGRIERGSGSGT
jgi:hypothetical protein